MNKQSVILFSAILVILLFVASCKSAEEGLAEKQKCFKRCMLENEDKAYCLGDCGMEEKDIAQTAELCGNGVCDEKEKSSRLCAKDCEIVPACAKDADCGEKQICTSGNCIAVACTIDSHCDDGYTCESNVCTKAEEALDTSAVENLKNDISGLQDKIDSLVTDIGGLQNSLDASDASDSDKAAIQSDIDDVDTAIVQLKVYNSTLNGYADDLDAAAINDDVAAVESSFNDSKQTISSYIDNKQSAVDAIQSAIDNLQSVMQADLSVKNLELNELSAYNAEMNVTYKNKGEGDINSSQSFRIKLTVFDLSNASYDDTKATILDTLGAGDSAAEAITVEVPHSSMISYFTAHLSANTVGIMFLVELDTDNTINESNETNNKAYYNITFDRADFITNAVPTAVISANATSVLAGEEITFSASNSSDSDGSISSSGYSWNFGDTYSSTSSAPTHSYSSAGTYTVNLTVTDNEGAIGADTETITVS